MALPHVSYGIMNSHMLDSLNVSWVKVSIEFIGTLQRLINKYRISTRYALMAITMVVVSG